MVLNTIINFNLYKVFIIIKMIFAKFFKPSLVAISIFFLSGCQINSTINLATSETKINDLIFLAALNEQNQVYDRAIELYLELSYAENTPRWAEKASTLAIENYLNTLALVSTDRWLTIDNNNFNAKMARLIVLLRDLNIEEFNSNAINILTGSLNPNENILVLARTLKNEENFIYALPTFERIHELYPSSAESAYVLSTLYLISGSLVESTKTANLAYQLRPNWTEVAIHFSRMLLLNQELTQGYKIGFNSAMKSTTNDQQLVFGDMLIETRNMLLAKHYYLNLYASQRDNASVISGLGIATYNLNQPGQAVTFFEDLSRFTLFEDQANYFLGLMAHKNMNYEGAFRYFSRVTESIYFIESHSLASNITSNIFNDLEGSLYYLDSLEVAYPSFSSELRLEKIYRLIEHAELEQAKNMAYHNQHLVNSSVDFGAIYTELSIAYISSLMANNNLRALDEVKILIGELEPNIQLLMLKSTIEQNLNRQNEALATLNLCLTIEPENPLVLNAIGYLLTDKLDNHNDAYNYINRAITLSPNNAAIQDSMGWVLFNLERYDEAIQYLELAYANFNDPEVIYHLVKAYQIIGPSNLYLHYKELLLNNYPNSYFSKLLQ